MQGTCPACGRTGELGKGCPTCPGFWYDDAENSVKMRIRNTITGLYWSNDQGWVDIHDADTFEPSEVCPYGEGETCPHYGSSICNLPMEGEWVL